MVNDKNNEERHKKCLKPGVHVRIPEWREATLRLTSPVLTNWIKTGLGILVVIAIGIGGWLASKPAPEAPDFAGIIHEYDPALLDASAREGRFLTVLIPFDRTRFFLIDGEPKGYEYDLVQAFADHINQSRPDDQPEISTVFLPTPFSQLLPLLEQGIGDLAAGGLTITEARAAKVDFSEPYLSDVMEVVVTRSDAPINSVTDLAGRTIHLSAGSSYIGHASDVNDALIAQGLEPMTIIEADPSLMSEDLLEMVNAGIIEMTAVDNHIAELWAQVLTRLAVGPVRLAEGNRIAWAVAKGNDKLRASLNEFIETAHKGTLLGNILFDRYFDSTQWIENPLSIAGLEKLQQYRGLLEQYGERYGFDWLMLAALVFQESRFDPNAKSEAGARGLMQLLPSTAQDMGFDALDDPETNIHAGTKYLAFLRDRYFNDQALEPQARDRLTLAAYNAGPARLAKLRKRAEEIGRDPNRWFNHVERAAQLEIGNETVRYVANINKYRIAYGLSEAVLAERAAATQ